MSLFHFATWTRYQSSLDAGEIPATWPECLSPLYPERVVWLTTDGDLQKQGWNDGSKVLAVRFTVNPPASEVFDWIEWRGDQSHPSPAQLTKLGRRSGGDPTAWRVVMRSLPRSEWVEIFNLEATKPIVGW